MSTSLTTKLGLCRDCAQGILTPAVVGFQLHVDGNEPMFWYCLYCGSNHVDILDSGGNIVVSQDDLYSP